MITITVKRGGFQKAMKQFKDAMYQTRTLQKHVDSLRFTKPSDERRAKKARAVYRQKIKTKADQA